jgi:hypothetical protein
MDINMQSPMPQPEHDDEGKMAKADLYKTAKYSLKLFKMMEDNAQLEGWVQAKITKAADYLASVYHYLEYEMKFTEYGRTIEDSEMYTESEKKILKNKLFEAKEKVKALKKAQAEKVKEKEKKKVDESEADIRDITADITSRGGDDNTKSDFNKVKTSSGHVRHSRKASRVKADRIPHGDTPMTSLHPDHDERAAKFLAKQVRGRKVSPLDQLTKRKGMTDLDEAKAKKAKKDYDGDGEVESGKDEVIGSRRKAAGLPFKEAADKKCNHTAKGKSCPVHGMKECSGMMEASSEDELNSRPGMWRGDAKRMTAKGKPTKDELGMQDNLKNRIKASNKKGGLTGPKGVLPEEQGVAEAKPSAGMSKGEKSAVAKKAQAGKDIGKPGKSFDKVAKAAGGGEKGTKIAAAAMWKNQAK